MKPYLLVLWDEIEPEIFGPFACEADRIKCANEKKGDIDSPNALIRIEADGPINVSTFSGYEVSRD